MYVYIYISFDPLIGFLASNRPDIYENSSLGALFECSLRGGNGCVNLKGVFRFPGDI